MKSSAWATGIAIERSVTNGTHAFKAPDEQRLAVAVVPRDLGAELANARMDVRSGQVHLADSLVQQCRQEALRRP